MVLDEDEIKEKSSLLIEEKEISNLKTKGIAMTIIGCCGLVFFSNINRRCPSIK